MYGPVARGRLYEEPFLDYIRSLRRRGQYVDVGAHLGTHTLWFAKVCGAAHVHAFEPVARYADVAERNMALNDLERTVTVHRVGLSDQPGRATNFLSREHQIGFVPEATGVNEEFPVARMDDVVRGRVDVIKLDVEGMEAAVLRGATRILSRYRPVIFAECHGTEEVEAVEAALLPFGYRRTGRVFNSSPTYEFDVAPSRASQWVRHVYGRLPAAVKGRIRRARKRR